MGTFDEAQSARLLPEINETDKAVSAVTLDSQVVMSLPNDVSSPRAWTQRSPASTAPMAKAKRKEETVTGVRVYGAGSVKGPQG